MAGPLMTANLGIEEIVRAVLARPTVRLLVVCGRDSPLFRQGRSLLALAANGISADDHQIVGAPGFLPYLRNLDQDQVDAFRRQVQMVDWISETDGERLAARLAALAGRRDRPDPPGELARPVPARGFAPLRQGGPRTPIVTAGSGFFIIVLDPEHREIVLRHHLPDLRPGHEMRGRRAESMLRGVVRAGLVSEPDHAGYLGAELAKAETALRLRLPYEQDKPLRADRGGWEENMDYSDFVRRVANVLAIDEAALHADQALEDQTAVDSLRMMELAVMLELELGVDLDDEVDLRRQTPAQLYRDYQRGRV